MSNFCSLQFSICFLQNLQGALQLTPMNNIVPQVVIELTYFWFRWEYSDDIPLTYKAGHDISRTLWQRRLLTLTFFLLPPSFVAHKYGDSANARRDQGRERVMVRLRLNILHAKYDHRQWREKRESGYSLLHSREMTPFPAAIIADFTLGKGKREERRFGCSKSTVESVKTLAMCTYK